MDKSEITIEQVPFYGSPEQSEKRQRLFQILSSVLPEYVGRLGLIEHSHKADVLVAVTPDNHVIGGLAGMLYEPSNSERFTNIEFVGMTEHFQGSGIGKKLISEYEDISREEYGVSQIELDTKSGGPALNAFRKMGFDGENMKEGHTYLVKNL